MFKINNVCNSRFIDKKDVYATSFGVFALLEKKD